jgi:hypothetical protein
MKLKKKEIIMLNKKLIAGSIFALMSAPALAVPSFSYTAGSVSQEGSATLANVALPEVTITSGAEYSDDDLIVIDYNVALATGYVPASTLSMYARCIDGTAGGATVITGDANDNGGELTLGLLSSNAAAGSVTYRVTDVSYAVTTSTVGGAAAVAGECVTSQNSSVGAALSLGTPLVDAAAARALGSVTGTYHATLPNGTTDIDGGLANLAFVTGAGAAAVTTSSMVNFVAQYADAPVGAAAGGNTGLSGTIDVTAGAPRSIFTAVGGAAAAQTASGIITVAKTAGLVSPTADVATTVTLYGDFSFLADENAVTPGIQNDAFIAGIAGGAAAAASTTITSSSMSWTFGTVAAPAAVGNVTISFDNGNNGDDGVVVAAGAGTRAISDGAFTYDVSLAYTDGGTDGVGAGAVAGTSALTSGGALGSWGLNGSSTVISNYPLSSAVTQFVWVTNTGAQDGGIFATAIGGTGAQTMASCDLGVSSGAGEIIRITDELNTCLTAAGMTAGRAEIPVTVNAAAASIGVYAGYKHDVDADRLNLTQ